MTSNLVNLTLQDHIAVINVSAEISESTAMAVEAALEKVGAYYQYERILLRVNSGGGLLRALRHMLDAIQNWREKGIRIETEVTFCAASAAAVLVSLGELGTRTVQRHSSLLYHHARLAGSDSAITATGANRLASLLESSDQKLMDRMITHMVDGSGGIQHFARQGQMRCELLGDKSAEIAVALELPLEKKNPSWLKEITKVFNEVEAKGALSSYQRYLAQRMEIDTAMDLREAYALCLIDRVHRVPSLQLPDTRRPTPIREHAAPAV